MASGFEYLSGRLPMPRVDDTLAAVRSATFYYMGTERQIRRLQRTSDGRLFLANLSSSYMYQKLRERRLVDLLHYFQLSETKEERDRYFALTGLAGDVTGQEAKTTLAPDYGSPIETIVIRFGSCLLQKPFEADMLLRAGLYQQHSTSQVPSWIQDFTCLNRPRRVVDRTVIDLGYNAAGDTPFHVGDGGAVGQRMMTSEFIVLRGALFDRVDNDAGEPVLNRTDGLARGRLETALEYASRGLHCFYNASDPCIAYPTREDCLEAVCAALIAGPGLEWGEMKHLLLAFRVLSWIAVVREEHSPAEDAAWGQWIYTHAKKLSGLARAEISKYLAQYVD